MKPGEQRFAASLPASSVHYWVMGEVRYRRMPVGGHPDAVCAFCGVRYGDTPKSWSYCPKSKDGLLREAEANG